MQNKYEAVIGLEVHAQLLTESKIFCGCSTKFGNPPNTNVCPICLGHPGVLPVLNKKMVEFTVLMGMAVNCTIRERSVFARKNYFYPDLPKGYQISQFEEPICEDGYIMIETPELGEKNIRIKRIHMEEDAGKSIHNHGPYTSIDLNRSGVPLIEIVTEPDISSAKEAFEYLTKIKQIVQYLGICDGNMEEGSLRCDANISIRLVGATELGTKTEIKNMNSFRNVERAINYEIKRQTELIEDGEKIIQQTLLWDADLNEAFPMRSKEDSHDYRYFPEPDLFPVVINEKWKKEIALNMPELPDARKERFIKDFSLPSYDAVILTQSRLVAEYYEAVVKSTDDYKSASNWVMVDILKILNETKSGIDEFPVPPSYIAELINIINDGTISSKIAKDVFAAMISENKAPSVIVKEKNLVQITNTDEIEKLIEGVLLKYPKEVEECRSGKDKVLGFFVGQIMKESKGKANPALVNKILKEKILS